MYLVLKLVCGTISGNSDKLYEVFATSDPLKVDDFLKRGFSIYKLDALKQVTEMKVTCKEKLA